MENNKRRMLTIGEAARLIEGITEYRIRQMCKSGQLRSFKAGNKFLIAESDLYETVFGTDLVSPHPCGGWVSPSVHPAPGKSSVITDGGKAAARCSEETPKSAQDVRI